MLGCVCFMSFFEKEPNWGVFRDLDVDVSESEISLAENIVKEMFDKCKK